MCHRMTANLRFSSLEEFSICHQVTTFEIKLTDGINCYQVTLLFHFLLNVTKVTYAGTHPMGGAYRQVSSIILTSTRDKHRICHNK